MRQQIHRYAALMAACAILGCAATAAPAQNPLSTGKDIELPPVGTQQNTGSLTMNLAPTPDGKYALSSDMGYREALWSIKTSSGKGVSHIDFDNTTNATNGLYYGIAISPANTFYAAQGQNNTIAIGSIAANGALTLTGSITTEPTDFPSGLSLDGRGYLYVANNDSDLPNVPGSVAVYSTATNAPVGRYTFSSSVDETSNFPMAIATLQNGSRTYVASQRDGVVYVLNTADPETPLQIDAIPTGSHPDALLISPKQNRLYVANADSDTVTVVDTATDRILDTILLRPDEARGLPGVSPNGLGLSHDGSTLYVTLGDMNAVAVVRTGAVDTLQGYIPAGWYPTGVVAAGDKLLVANAKGVKTRYPNKGYVQFSFAGEYDLNLIEGTVATIDVPSTPELARYTERVLRNNHIDQLSEAAPEVVMRLHGKIKHVIYIIKENRTYDQILGDVPGGNGDPSLALFGLQVTPNLHALATRFVLLDNFFDCSEASGDGWPWSTGSYANEYVIKNLPYNYSGRGRNYDFEGQNNGYLAGGFPATDPDGNQNSQAYPAGAPPIVDVAEAFNGHLWDDVENAGLSYRNYGFFYSFGVTEGPVTVFPDNYPTAAGILPPGHDLAGKSDWDFRRFDETFADSDAPQLLYNRTGNPNALYPTPTYGKHNADSRFQEWNTEFQEMLTKDPTGGSVPALMTVRFHHDHTEGLEPGHHSPRSDVADNDYAVGQLVQAVSQSPIWDSTAIFVIEDDAQDGPDHVDCHRSTCYVISPYIKESSVDHTFYNTDSVLRTMEILMGVKPLSNYDATATPILDWTSTPANGSAYAVQAEDDAIISEINPTLSALRPGSPAYKLAKQAMSMDFVHPDSAPADVLNDEIWKSVKGMDSTAPSSRHNLEIASAKVADSD